MANAECRMPNRLAFSIWHWTLGWTFGLFQVERSVKRGPLIPHGPLRPERGARPDLGRRVPERGLRGRGQRREPLDRAAGRGMIDLGGHIERGFAGLDGEAIGRPGE